MVCKANHWRLKDRAEIKSTPVESLQICEAGLPELVDGRGLIFELAGGLDHDIGAAGPLLISGLRQLLHERGGGDEADHAPPPLRRLM